MSASDIDTWHELWGTFSVRDHIGPGAFVAEALIYDRLIVPVVPTADDLAQEAAQRGERIDAKKLAQLEWERWEKEEWEPARQRALAEILIKKKRADLVPWTFALMDEWDARMKEGFADARRNGYFMTGSVLQRFAPAMARAVVAVSRYHSLKELEDKEGIRRRAPHEPLEASTLVAVLGHELFLPGEPDQDDFRNLEEALDVGADATYRERRRDLYQWQQQFIRDGQTDARSIHTAVERMRAMVDDVRTATAAQKHWKWVRQFFNLFGLGAKAVGVGVPAAAPFAAAGGVVASAGTFVVDELAPKPSRSIGLPAATLVLDAQTKLGIE